MAILMSYSESNKDNYDEVRQSNSNGQALNNLPPCTITAVTFYLCKKGSPTGNATVSLFACTGSPGSTGKPTGSALAVSQNYDVSTIPGVYTLITFTFATPYSWAGGNLCIDLEYTGGDTSNDIGIGNDLSSPTDPGNAYYSLDGPFYTPVAGADYCYYVYGNLAGANLFFLHA
jgi:hypothetical protein